MGRSNAISEERSKYFSSRSDSAGPLRRSARSSLAKSYVDEDDSDDGQQAASDVTYGSDIEDAIKTASPSPPPRGGVIRKRKRTTTTTTIKPSPSSPVVKTEVTELETSTIPSPSKPRRARKPARATTSATTGETTVSPPSDWEEMYALVKEMRISGPAANAAVDTMGCERLAAPDASVKDRRFHTLVALMLSSQTKDTVNAEAMARLQKELPPWKNGEPAGLNLQNMLAVDPALLNELIWKVGFHNNKTKYLKQAAVILRDKHDGDIPDTIEGMMALPGVGPKMAHLCMSAENGWNRVEGIGVDVHVHRITNLWGWQSPPSKTPEETRLALQAWLPHDKWKEINWLLVGLGQAVCLPVGRKCGDCELGIRGLCKSAERKKVLEGRKRRGMVVKKEEDGTVVKKEEEIVDEVIKDEVVDEARLEGQTEEEPSAAGRSRKRQARATRG
ncbi:DNA glycosylase [Thozetella sp. PMI_491]|nr:DNA glycosylase [Thozetella sp. PMI_491]